MKGRKVAPAKYRNRRTALKRGQDAEPCRDGWPPKFKAVKKREDFAIHKSAAKAKRVPVESLGANRSDGRTSGSS